jgi:hypothetical protein
MFSFRELPNYSDLMASEFILFLMRADGFHLSSDSVHSKFIIPSNSHLSGHFNLRDLNRVSKSTESFVVNHSILVASKNTDTDYRT